MIDESQTINEEAILIAPEPDATAAPDVVETPAPDGDEPETKTFTQEEIDEIVAKRLAKAERKWRREQAQTPEPVAYEPPVDDEVYTPTADQIIARHEAQKQQQAMLEAYHEREEAALEKYDDFQQVAYNPNLKITDVMATTIQASEIGPDVIYWLGSNPKEAARIASLPQVLQAKEIGKIEAKLETDPPARKTTTAPAPISPVTARTNAASIYDTTDPRAVKTLNRGENATAWIEAERQRVLRERQARM